MPAAKRRTLTLLLWAFPVILWLICTGALLAFDLGKFSDDYAVNLRTPETDAYTWPASPFTRWNYFWRPLHLLSVYALATTFWHHDWVNHLLSALAHLAVALLLYRLLRALELSRSASSIGTVVVLAFPLGSSAVLWPAALGSVVGVAMFLVLALTCLRIWSTSQDISFVRLVGVFLLAFLVPCWHEQPAACVLALPILAFAAPRPPSLPTFLRTTLAAALGVAAYVIQFMLTVPRIRRGGQNTLVTLDLLPDRLARLAEQTWNFSFGPRSRATHADLFDVALPTLSSPLAIATYCILLLAGAAWLVTLAHPDRQATPPARPLLARTLWAGLFGVLVALASILPIAVVLNQPMATRYLYPLGAGSAILLAAAAQLLPDRASTRFATGLAALILCACSSIFWLGMQILHRDRSLADARQAQQLLQLVPNPPPHAVFVPVSIADIHPSQSRLRTPIVPGALAHSWSCWAYIQHTYARTDLTSTHTRFGRRPPIRADLDSVQFPRGLAGRWGIVDPARISQTWDKVVPFAVDADGTVWLLDKSEVLRQLDADSSRR